MLLLFTPQWALDTISSSAFTQQRKPHNLSGVSLSPTASNWSRIQRGPQVFRTEAYQSARTAGPEGNPTIPPLIKGGSALNKTWTGTVFHTWGLPLSHLQGFRIIKEMMQSPSENTVCISSTRLIFPQAWSEKEPVWCTALKSCDGLFMKVIYPGLLVTNDKKKGTRRWKPISVWLVKVSRVCNMVRRVLSSSWWSGCIKWINIDRVRWTNIHLCQTIGLIFIHVTDFKHNKYSGHGFTCIFLYVEPQIKLYFR